MRRNPRFSRRPPPTRALEHEFDDPRQFSGGARVGAGGTSRPFARLTFDREVACVSFRYLLPTVAVFRRSPVWILRSEVSEVVRSGGTLFTRGVMFAGDPDLYAGVLFWTKDRDALLAAFVAAGWPVEPEA